MVLYSVKKILPLARRGATLCPPSLHTSLHGLFAVGAGVEAALCCQHQRVLVPQLEVEEPLRVQCYRPAQ